MSDSARKPSRLGLILPFVALIIAVVLHAVYWTYTASQIEQRALVWIETQQEAGYEVSYGGLRVGGYPFRFALRAEAPELVAPAEEGGWTAQVERLSASAQFYNLGHWIVTPDGLGQVMSAGEAYALEFESAQLSLRARNGATGQLGASVDGLQIRSLEGPEPAVRTITALRLSGLLSEEDSLGLRLVVEGMTLGEGVLDPALVPAFGGEVELVSMDARVTQWSALARRADPMEWRLADGRFVVDRSQLLWGPAEITGTGDIGLDNELLPDGRLSVVVVDPETLIGALEAGGLVVDQQGEALRAAALMAPRREGGIALPFRLRQGAVFLGPARLGTFAERDG
jgi:hypothetical protein